MLKYGYNKGKRMKVKTVTTKKQMKLFINLPGKIYGDHLCYIPPLWIDKKSI